MESAKAWLIGGNDDDYADHRAKLRRNLKPAPQAPLDVTSSKKRKNEGKKFTVSVKRAQKEYLICKLACTEGHLP